MSSDTPRPAREVLPIAESLVDLLRPYTHEIMIAGSLRRRKPMVGDVEIVAKAKPDLLTRLDQMVAEGVVTKALYGEKRPTPHWGTLHRGMVYQGMKHEIFLYDDENRGYQQWLRTGPGDANTVIMVELGRRLAPIRFQEGYCWRGAWEFDPKRREWNAANRTRLRLRTEHDLFAVLGMPFIEPEKRSADLYRKILRHPKHRWGDPEQFIERQTVLFDINSFLEAEWRTATSAPCASAGKTTAYVPFRWREPFVLDDGRVWAKVRVGPGQRTWAALSPTDERAVKYRETCLDGEHPEGGLFVQAEANDLRAWLHEQREAMMREVLAEAMQILRGAVAIV